MASSPVEATAVEVKTHDASDKDSHHSKATLFVRNIPYDATNQELEEFFSDLGPIRSCFVVTDNTPEETGKVQNKGFGYVHYALAEDAQRALTELKDIKFRGARKLKIELALKKGEKAPERPAPKSAAAKPAAVQSTPVEKPTTQPADLAKSQEQAPDVPQDHYLTVQVSGIGADTTKKHIYKRARKIATVENISYPIEDNEGVARIKFGSYDDAKLGAKQLDGHIFKGATLKAQVMASGAPPVQTKTNDYYVDKTARLIVRNLPWKYLENDLAQLFGEYGKVHEVRLPRKFPGGPQKGFAFIQFGNIDEAEKAINALNATEHHGRTIAVDWALSKDKFIAAEEEPVEEADAEENEAEMDVDVEKEEDSMDVEAENEEQENGSDNEADEDEEIEGVLAEDEEDIDIEDDEDEEEEEEEEDEDEEEEVKPTYTMPKPAEGTTLFVRNLLFESQEEDLRELFSQWGALRYAKITMDKETGRSRGTGFVCFKERSSADQCLEEAEEMKQSTLNDTSEAFPTEMMSNKQKKKSGIVQKSLLTPDVNTGLAKKFTLQGRVLDVNRAVERNEANKLMEANAVKKQKEDKRNIYLMKEGVIFADTTAAATMPEAELRKRQMSFAARKKLIASNPSLFISKTRLSIRNLPLKIDDKDLKQIGMESITNFKRETKSGQRTDLSADEKAEGWSFKPFVKQAKIIRSKDRVEATTKKLRSKGYGFLEFRTHAHALAALRYLNNNSKVFPGDPRRLIVEFSVDNKDVVERRAQRPIGGRPSTGDASGRSPRDRPTRDGHPRSTGDRPTRGRPTRGRPTGGRPTGDRSTGGRPTGDRSTGGRPTGGRPTRGRPTGDRPRPTGDRSAGGGGRFAGNKRKASDEDGGRKDFNKRIKGGPQESKGQRPMMKKRTFNNKK